MNDLIGEERQELGEWILSVILFNHELDILEVVLLEPHQERLGDIKLFICQAIERTEGHWTAPTIKNAPYYITIIRCQLF